MADFRNTQTAILKMQLEPVAQKSGRSVEDLFLDSMFNGIQTVLLPRKFEKEFKQYEKGLALYNEQYCTCANKVKGKTALDKLNAVAVCGDRKKESNTAWRMIMNEATSADRQSLIRLDHTTSAYVFSHCPLFTRLLREHMDEIIPDDDDANDTESLLMTKIRLAKACWQRKSLDTLTAVFPGYVQYSGQLNQVTSEQYSKYKSDFEVKKSVSRLRLEYIFYMGRGENLVIISRVVYSFTGNSSASSIRSVEITPFEQLPDGRQLLDKMREDTHGNPPPPPPPPKRKN